MLKSIIQYRGRYNSRAMDIEEQYDKIYRFCYYRVKNKETAEDLTQETFLRFLKAPMKSAARGSDTCTRSPETCVQRK